MHANSYNRPNSRLIQSLDLVVDFATLGEYRVVTDRPRRRVRTNDMWADAISWTQPQRSRELVCTLPRARDRKLARERIRG